MRKEITVKFYLDGECQQLLERFLLLKPFSEDELLDGNFVVELESDLSGIFLKSVLSRLTGENASDCSGMEVMLACLLGMKYSALKREEERLLRFPLAGGGTVVWSLLDDVLAGPDAPSVW